METIERKLNCGKMPKPQMKADWKALGWNRQEVLPLNSTFPKIRESSPARRYEKSLLVKMAPKVITRPAPSSERAGTGKSGVLFILGHR